VHDRGAVSTLRYRFLKVFDPTTVIVRWHSELLRTKNPLLKDMPADEVEQTLSAAL